jgi:hypothetical protein
MKRNEIKLYTPITVDGRTMVTGNFFLSEFEMREGTVMVHPSVLISLEMLRYDLNAEIKRGIKIIITGSTRSEATNNDLGAKYGWIDHGGTVSRVSRHLPKYGGIAVDFYAVYANGKRVAQKKVGEIARRHFDYVKDDYSDGHIHGDNRNKKP